MSDHTTQVRKFMGAEDWEWTKGLWESQTTLPIAAAERHDSAESHISSIRKLNKPLPRNVAGDIDYTSKDMYDVARTDNTSKNLKSNFWQETANILRWATTFSMMGMAVAATKIFAGGAITLTAATLVPMAAAGAVAVVAGASMFYASRKARRLSTEKVFDNQEFVIQRQSQLIGKAVENERESGMPKDSQWQERVGRDMQAGQKWQTAVRNELDENLSAGPAV